MTMFFRQVQKNGDNFSYIIADESAKEAAIIDSSYNGPEIISILKAAKFTLRYIIRTHAHPDHLADDQLVQSTLGGQTVGYLSSKSVDIKVKDGDVLQVGALRIEVLYTPGHTIDSICLLVDGKKLLAGDTLFVDECGRTDLPGGNSIAMYESLFGKLLKLDDDVAVYPGHNYGPKSYSTIGEQRRTNYVLKPRNAPEFVEFMSQP
jgi:hydroxyacylglutathione hydrolase